VKPWDWQHVALLFALLIGCSLLGWRPELGRYLATPMFALGGLLFWKGPPGTTAPPSA